MSKYVYNKYPLTLLINEKPATFFSDNNGNVIRINNRLVEEVIFKSPLVNPKDFINLTKAQYIIYIKLCNHAINQSKYKPKQL
jgi:hypothetical protein